MTDKPSKTRDSVIVQFIDWAGCALILLAASISALLLSLAAAIWFTWVM